MKRKSIVSKEESDNIVFDYHPKEFPTLVTSEAQDFVKQQDEEESDFMISDLVSQQVGIAQIRKRGMEEQIQEKALQKLKEMEQKAYKEAYELGMIEGAERAFEERKEEFEERLNALDEMIGSVDIMLKKIAAENESHMMKILLLIARKIAMREIEMDPKVIIDVINGTVEEVYEDENIVVRLSNKDLLFLSTLREKAKKHIENIDHIKFEGSDDIAAGGCLIETKFGMIDATLEQRVDKVWETISSRLPRIKAEQAQETDQNEENVSASEATDESSNDSNSDDGSGEDEN